MDNEIINASLRRSIKSGSQYDQLIPKSTCEVQSLGNGKNNTIEGVNFMADWVKTHSHQVKKLAKTLEKSSLQETVASIWRFLYYHFQYDADGELQKLRSPACSWAQRQSGIDCKSYTILACSLLREMGYASYIRQIKQPGYFENEFTHVYAIVPIDQSNPPNTSYFTKDYYVIDATVSDNKEPKYIEAKDKIMSGLPYQGMKGKVPGCSPRTAKLVIKASNAGRRLYQSKSSGGRDLAKWRHGSLKAPAQNSIITKLYNLESIIIAIGFQQITFNAMLQYAYTLIESGIPANQIKVYFETTGLKIGVNRQGRLFRHPYLSGQQFIDKFKQISSPGLNSETSWLADIDWGSLLDSIGSLFGGSQGWYKSEDVETNATKLTELYINYISEFNNGITTNNAEKTAKAVVRLRNTAKIIKQGFEKKKSEGWSNFTEQNLQTSIDFSQKLESAINTALSAYLNAYTTTTSLSLGSITFNQSDYSKNNNSGANISSMHGLHVGSPVTFTVPVTNGYKPKTNVNVPKFEFTQPIIDSIKTGGQVNTSNFLDTLQDIIVAVSPSNPQNQNPNNQNPNNQNGNDQGTWNGIGQDTKTSSLVWFGLALAGGYVFRKPILNALNIKNK